MPLPTTCVQSQVTELIAEAKFLKKNAQAAIVQMAAGPVSANAIIGTVQRYSAGNSSILTPALTNSPLLVSLAQETGMANEAAALAAVQAVVNAIGDVAGWVFSNFPKTSSGNPLYILKDTINASGSLTVRQFSTAQTAGLRTELQKIVDAIGS